MKDSDPDADLGSRMLLDVKTEHPGLPSRPETSRPRPKKSISSEYRGERNQESSSIECQARHLCVLESHRRALAIENKKGSTGTVQDLLTSRGLTVRVRPHTRVLTTSVRHHGRARSNSRCTVESTSWSSCRVLVPDSLPEGLRPGIRACGLNGFGLGVFAE